MNVEAIRDLYNSNSTARAFFDHAAKRSRNRSETTVERTIQNLSDNGTTISRADVVKFFQKLQDLDCGKFIPGRHNHRSRFAWELELTSVARAAAGEPEDVQVTISSDPEEFDAEDWLLTHDFHLREDFKAQINLPYDLTREEADRLAMFIKALPFETD